MGLPPSTRAEVRWKEPTSFEAHSAFSPSSVRPNFVPNDVCLFLFLSLPCTPPLLVPRQCHATMLHGWGTTNMNWSRHSALMNGRREVLDSSEGPAQRLAADVEDADGPADRGDVEHLSLLMS